LVDTNEFDWEIAFLSCKCKFKRNPDKFNDWVLSFFRNLDKNLLMNIKKEVSKNMSDESYFEVNGHKIQRFCPHMKYDLERHGEVDENKKVIRCLGHCWEWDLETGKGINTTKDLKVKCGVGVNE